VRRDRDPRTGPFEEAVRTGSDQRAQATLHERLAYWQRFDAKKAEQKEEEAIGSATLVGLLVSDALLTIGILLGFFGFAAAGVLGTVAILVGVPVIVVALGFVAMNAYRKKKASFLSSVNNLRAQQIRQKLECPGCGYDLAGCRDAIEIESSHRVGPDRCPECGNAWPLVLDATPDEMARWYRGWFRAHQRQTPI